MLDKLKEQLCIDISPVRVVEGRTGHAIIQVDEIGQNAIMIYGGANRTIDKAYIDDVLAQYGEGDVLVLQNEISGLQYAIDAAYEKKMFIVLNPSPCTRELLRSDLTKISMFCLNEIEGRSMTSYVQPGDILIRLAEMYPNSQFLFTLGSQGAFYKNGTRQIYQASLKVPVVDSTAAGDVFEGYFLAAYLYGKDAEVALKYATYASALSVTKRGAAYFSAPTMDKVEEYMMNPKHRPDFNPAPPVLENA